MTSNNLPLKTITSKERLLSVLRGERADRVPVFTQIPFKLNAAGNFYPGPFHGYEDYDDWRACDPEYHKLVNRMEKECDNFFIWRPACMKPDRIFVPAVDTTSETLTDGRVQRVETVKIDGKALQSVFIMQPGTGHTWQTEHFCKDSGDACALLEMSFDPVNAGCEDYFDVLHKLGNRGVIWVTIPSPLLAVCRLFDPTTFLMLTATDPCLINRLMETATRRIAAILEVLLQEGCGPVIRFGGAEHATPPLMSERDFDWLVTQYDDPLMRLCKEHGRLVAVHCHGNIRHALKRFVEMGFDQTDPVEQLPDGNITLTEARTLSRNRITLTGNIQMRELHNGKPEEIKARVRQIINEAGCERLIITTTGTPLERIDDRLAANYHAMIDATLKYGKID